MKCFGPCQFLRGLWTDHMRTDAMNLVTTARTIHLPEEKETIHMISMLRRKLGQEVFMILVTFQLRIVWQIV